MLPICFKKETALHYLDCLRNDRRIEPDLEQSGWTSDEMLQLAGACFLALATRAPEWRKAMSQQHREHREAEMEAIIHDLHAAILFAAQLTQLAHDGNYDDRYDAHVRCGVEAVHTRVETSVAPLEGFKEG